MAPRDGRILVAVSGGPDSTALLLLLLRLSQGLNLTLHVAHYDHGLR
jgi:tRNA(Ile)-lysidine synthase